MKLGVVLTGMVVVACATPDVKPGQSVPLDRTGPYVGLQKSVDYQLTYRYVFHAGAQPLTDHIAFTGKLIPRRGLATFRLHLYILNDKGQKIATHLLYAPGTGQGAARTAIDRVIPIPPGAVAIAFSHFSQENIRTPRFGR